MPMTRAATMPRFPRRGRARRAPRAPRNGPGRSAPETKAAQVTAKKAKATEDALNKEYTKQTKVIAPLRTTVSGAYFLVALLVLLIPSLFGGQTLGKRLQKIRVVKMAGSRAGAG